MSGALRRHLSAMTSSASSTSTISGSCGSSATGSLRTAAAMSSSSSSPPLSPSSLSSSRGRDSQTCTLPDGRTLGFSEYGHSDGRPLIYFHGFPSSRLEAGAMDAAAKRHNLRVFCLDRPGFGLSTLQPGRRIIDWPDDVLAFASKQKLTHFGIMGGSGGGPYALACARKLPPEMVTGVGVMAGGGPFDGSADGYIPRRSQLTAFLAKHWPSGLRLIIGSLVGSLRWFAQTNLAKRWLDQWLEGLSKKEKEKKAAKKAAKKKASQDTGESVADAAGIAVEDVATSRPAAAPDTRATTATSSRLSCKDVGAPLQERAIKNKNEEKEDSKEDDGDDMLTIPVKREKMLRVLFEAFAQGAEATVHEAQVLSQDWGFKFGETTYNPIMFWHGDKDANAPLLWVKPMIDRLPYSILKVYEGKTHYSLVEDVEEMLAHFAPGKEQAASKEKH